MTAQRLLSLLAFTVFGFSALMAQPGTAQAHKDRGPVTYIYQPAPACRDYTRTVLDFGNVRVSTGTACQRQDGNWYVVREAYPPRRFYAQPTRVVFVGDRQGYGRGGWVRYDDDRRDRHDDHDRGHHRNHRGRD